MFDATRYKIHTFSLHPDLVKNNDLTEEQIQKEYINFHKLFATEDNPNRVYTDSDILDDQKRFQAGLHEDKGVYVLVEDTTVEKIVGLSDMTWEQYADQETAGASLGFAYVLSDHRGRGIYTEMVRERVKTARTLGYTELFADPIDDGKSFRVLQKEKFSRNPTGTLDLSVKLDLTGGGIETPYGSGSNPQFRK